MSLSTSLNPPATVVRVATVAVVGDANPPDAADAAADAGMERLSWVEECADCEGSGLTRAGGDEHRLAPGIFTPCPRCEGQGGLELSFSYRPYRGQRSPAPAAARKVYAAAVPGTRLELYHRGGLPPAEALADPEKLRAPGAEPRDVACPAQWRAAIDPEWSPDWQTCRPAHSHRNYARCPMYGRKGECWRRRDSGGYDFLYTFGELHVEKRRNLEALGAGADFTPEGRLMLRQKRSQTDQYENMTALLAACGFTLVQPDDYETWLDPETDDRWWLVGAVKGFYFAPGAIIVPGRNS